MMSSAYRKQVSSEPLTVVCLTTVTDGPVNIDFKPDTVEDYDGFTVTSRSRTSRAHAKAWILSCFDAGYFLIGSSFYTPANVLKVSMTDYDYSPKP